MASRKEKGSVLTMGPALVLYHQYFLVSFYASLSEAFKSLFMRSEWGGSFVKELNVATALLFKFNFG